MQARRHAGTDTALALLPRERAVRRARALRPDPGIEPSVANPVLMGARSGQNGRVTESSKPTQPNQPIPSLAELLISARVVSIPMRTRFRGIKSREAMLVQGPAGWGEWAPFLEYGPEEAARWLASAIEAAWTGWPEPQRTEIPVNATVPAVRPGEVEGVLGRYDGFGAVKIKVAELGQTLDDDVDRVARVRAVVGPDMPIRVDANGGWTMEDALGALEALAEFELEYAEQPVATVEEMAQVRRMLRDGDVPVKIAADESIRRAEDPRKVVEAGAADLMVVKVAPLGGVAGALRVAEEVGLPAVVSSAIDTSVGLRAGVALAAALPELPFACGLGTATLLVGDVADPSLAPVGGTLQVRDVEPDPDLLDRYAAPQHRADWWYGRLAEALPHLPKY